MVDMDMSIVMSWPIKNWDEIHWGTPCKCGNLYFYTSPSVEEMVRALSSIAGATQEFAAGSPDVFKGLAFCTRCNYVIFLVKDNFP